MSGADWGRLRRALHPLHAGVPTGESLQLPEEARAGLGVNRYRQLESDLVRVRTIWAA